MEKTFWYLFACRKSRGEISDENVGRSGLEMDGNKYKCDENCWKIIGMDIAMICRS